MLSLTGCVRVARHRYEASRAKETSRSVVVTGSASVPEQVRAELESIVRGGVPGVTAIAMRDGKVLFRVEVGDIGPATQYSVASASKWMATALVMTVVDEGSLALDESISNVLPEFRGAAGRITLPERRVWDLLPPRPVYPRGRTPDQGAGRDHGNRNPVGYPSI